MVKLPDLREHEVRVLKEIVTQMDQAGVEFRLADFLDVDSMPSGHFSSVLLERIKQAADVVVVVSEADATSRHWIITAYLT